MGHLPIMNSPSDPESPASAGDAQVQFTSASRMMAQANSFESFEGGVALLEEAARNGHAEAICTVATLEAIGASRPRNWDRAFDGLQLAAERGSEHARDQLRLLGNVSDDGDQARARIDLGRLLHAPAALALSERPRVRVFEGFASAAECRWVIDRFRPKLGPATIWDGVSGRGEVDPRRSNSAVEVPVTEMDVVTEVVRARISAATRLPEFIFEVPQVMQYLVGQEFKPHHDFLDPQFPALAADLAKRGQRMGTFLIFLNDDFEGGETEFPMAGVSYRGRAGDALFFANITPDGRPDPLTLHAGRPPTKGEKWIFSQWIRDRPPVASPS
jgi:prolyl 4-hydroxylase